MLLTSASLLVAPLMSCGVANSPAGKQKVAWDSANAPEKIGLNKRGYETDFYRLKKNAQLSQKPWSGSYWPTYKGGISYRWAHPSMSDQSRVFYKIKKADQLSSQEIRYLSPSEKIDLYLGDSSYSVTQHERKRTNVMSQLQGHKIPKWFGLCHAWAPATLFYKSPNPVTLTNKDGIKIPFGSSDIKALLIHFLDQAPSRDYFVSRRCNIDDKALRKKAESGAISFNEYNRRMESANCIGVNPGAFHIILTNMIGIKDEGFVADVTRDAEVWNQAIHGYSSKIIDSRTRNFSRGADSKTVKEIKISTSMYYTTEIGASWKSTIRSPSQATKFYQYWIELDKNGKIIGGTWESKERPDFLWKKMAPSFKGRTDKAIERIYKLSINEETREEPTREEPTREEPTREEPTRDDSGDNEPGDAQTSSIIQIKASVKKKVFAGVTFKFNGTLATNAKKLRVKYYSRNGKMISDKKIKIRSKNKFLAKTFFFDFQKPTRVKMEAFDKNNKLIDTIQFKL